MKSLTTLLARQRVESKFGPYVVPTIVAGSDLPAPPARPIYSAHAFLINLAACIQWLVNYAADLLPDTFADDPSAAMRGALAIRRLAFCDDRTAIADMAQEEWIPRDLWATRELLAQALEGEELADGNAAQAAPDVLPATRKHAANLLGEVKTYRAHMTVRDNSGNVAGTFDLLRQANEILTRNGRLVGNMLTGEITQVMGTYALIGSEDRAYPPTIEHSPEIDPSVTINGKVIKLGRIRPDHGVSVGNGRYKSNGERKGSLAHTCQPAPSYERISKVFERDDKGKLVKPLVWTGEYRDKGTVTGSVSTTDLPALKVPYVSTTVVKGYGTTYSGRSIIGRGTWQTSIRAKRVNAAQAIAAALIEVTDIEARTVAEAESLKLTEQPQGACRPIASFKLILTNGTIVTVRKSDGKPFKVTLKPIDAKRRETSTTAPKYVGAIVANHLAST